MYLHTYASNYVITASLPEHVYLAISPTPWYPTLQVLLWISISIGLGLVPRKITEIRGSNDLLLPFKNLRFKGQIIRTKYLHQVIAGALPELSEICLLDGSESLLRRRKCRDKLHLLSCEDTTDNVLLYCLTLKLCQQKCCTPLCEQLWCHQWQEGRGSQDDTLSLCGLVAPPKNTVVYKI